MAMNHVPETAKYDVRYFGEYCLKKMAILTYIPLCSIPGCPDLKIYLKFQKKTPIYLTAFPDYDILIWFCLKWRSFHLTFVFLDVKIKALKKITLKGGEMKEKKNLSPFFARFLEGNVVRNLAGVRGGGTEDGLIEKAEVLVVETTSSDTLKYPSDGDDVIDKPK
jgi:hypothetical protein